MKVAYLIEPPFNYRDENKTVTGCDIELAKYVFQKLGINDFEFVETEFSDLLPGLAQGKWQMTTGLFAIGKRQRIALFSRPVWALPDGLLVKASHKADLEGYQSIAKETNSILAVIRDQFQHDSALHFGIPDNRIIVFETYVEAAEAVEEGRASAYASVARAHEGYLQQQHKPDLKVVIIQPSEKPPAFGCFGFARNDTRLQMAVDDVLTQFLGSKQHREMMSTFGFSASDIDLLL